MLQLIAIASLAISSIVAQPPSTNYINGQCVQNYDASIDYFPEKLNTANDKGQYFSIEYHNNYKVVNNHRTGYSYILVQCGTPKPTNVSNSAEIYEIPITKAAAMETSVVPYLEMIGAAKTVALTADGSLVASPCFQEFWSNSTIQELSSTNQTLQEEQIKSVQVQFGSNPYATAATAVNTTVTTASAYEPDVLGRSSWISYYAAFYNLEGASNNITEAMLNNYNRLREASSHYDKKPVVAWTTYDAPSSYNNNTASYIISNASYKVGLTQDAGATLVTTEKNTFGSASELLDAIRDVDILIDETFIGSNLIAFLQNYNISDTTKYKFLQKNQVYREDGTLSLSGGYDWFEAPVAMADALLEDMINVVNPSAPNANYQRRWLRNIALNEPIKYVTQANCSWNEDAPRPNLASTYNGPAFTLSSGAMSKLTYPQVVGAILTSISTLAYLI